MKQVLSHLLTMFVGAVICFLWMSTEVADLEDERDEYVAEVQRYNKVVVDLHKEGRSDKFIDNLVFNNCIPIMGQIEGEKK